MSQRIKIINVKPVPYSGTAQGIIDLAERIKKEGIPRNAAAEYRPWNVMEFVWSALDESKPQNQEV